MCVGCGVGGGWRVSLAVAYPTSHQSGLLNTSGVFSLCLVIYYVRTNYSGKPKPGCAFFFLSFSLSLFPFLSSSFSFSSFCFVLFCSLGSV